MKERVSTLHFPILVINVIIMSLVTFYILSTLLSYTSNECIIMAFFYLFFFGIKCFAKQVYTSERNLKLYFKNFKNFFFKKKAIIFIDETEQV